MKQSRAKKNRRGNNSSYPGSAAGKRSVLYEISVFCCPVSIMGSTVRLRTFSPRNHKTSLVPVPLAAVHKAHLFGGLVKSLPVLEVQLGGEPVRFLSRAVAVFQQLATSLLKHRHRQLLSDREGWGDGNNKRTRIYRTE